MFVKLKNNDYFLNGTKYMKIQYADHSMYIGLQIDKEFNIIGSEVLLPNEMDYIKKCRCKLTAVEKIKLMFRYG